MSLAAAYCALRQLRQARESRAAIGILVTVPPQMQGEPEAWVAIRVPFIEPRPQRKLSPYEMPLVRVRCILDRIF
jgi:hypothetical protein